MYKKTTTWWQDFLKAESQDNPAKWLNIQEVRLTSRLVDTPVAIVTSQFGYSAKMEKAYSSQGQDLSMAASKTLELNPDHPVIHELWKKIEAESSDDAAKDTAVLLTQAAILASGYRLEDPENIIKSVHGLLMQRRGIDINVPVTEIAIEKEEEPEADVAEDAETETDDDDDDDDDEE